MVAVVMLVVLGVPVLLILAIVSSVVRHQADLELCLRAGYPQAQRFGDILYCMNVMTAIEMREPR